MATPSYNRHIDENKPSYQVLDACEKAMRLSVHTIKITSNEKVFDPKHKTIIEDLTSTAIGIYADAWQANNVYVGDSAENWHLRSNLQEKAISECYRLLALINVSKLTFGLRAKKCNYWFQLAVDTKDVMKKWRDSDRKRYGNLK